ncbi:type II toxin-antitoxin system VapC family toxin [Sphaerimonospora thailandensis]|uniref:Ribonuclease VapC n=1 Tax=Sphaerimonospora thailandensis TaxID=795644 RepID=A0A8J3VZW2_9ACTN|nr:type II toxin-antitoxin system VapC family toxin [Sphaerimonospora thailandensis]GIH70473.1 ribonuclease VapC9 [Sphaerimonospora thailandensis]
MIVVDASVFAFALLDEGPVGDRCRAALADDDRWIAPEHWMTEVASVIRGHLLGRKITLIQATGAITALGEIAPVVPLTRVLLPRMWELRSNITTYDAAYVAAAEAYGCPLLTTDARLSRVSGLGCPVHVLFA